MRILITEIGNDSSGDTAQYIAAAKRLRALGAEVTLLYRANQERVFEQAGVQVRHVNMPIGDRFEGVSTAGELVNAFAYHRPDLYERLMRSLRRQDVVVVAPGGRYVEGYNNARNLLTAAVALKLNLPVIILPQSIGPIDNPDHRKLIVEVFTPCHLVLLRDKRSLEFLLELGVPADRARESRDVVFAETYDAPREHEYELGVNIRCGFNGHVNMQAVSEFLRSYKAARPRSRVFVYSTTSDLPADVVRWLTSEPCEVQPRMPAYPSYLREVGRCAINVSDSLHGVLFSMMAGRPVVCCQTDFSTWKIGSIHAPEQEPLEVLPGLVGREEAHVVLDRVLAVENNPQPVLEQQRRIVEYGRQMSEAGWTAVEHSLDAIHRPSPHSAIHRALADSMHSLLGAVR